MGPALRARLRRGHNLLAAALAPRPPAPLDVPAAFFIKAGYKHRDSPGYDDAFGTPGIVWQPRVYAAAAAAARAVGATRIVDVGAGNGAKLAALHPEFELVGIDTGPNLEGARESFPFVRWLDRDLDRDEGLGLDHVAVADAAIVCADVVEHLRRPDLLLSSLRRALDYAKCIVVSTPERDLLWGTWHMGPPPNQAHAREWTRREFAAFLASAGFRHARLTLTQSRSGSPLKNTILAVLAPDEVALQRAFSAAADAQRGRRGGLLPDGSPRG